MEGTDADVGAPPLCSIASVAILVLSVSVVGEMSICLLPQYAARDFLCLKKHFVDVLRGLELRIIEDHHASKEGMEAGLLCGTSGIGVTARRVIRGSSTWCAFVLRRPILGRERLSWAIASSKRLVGRNSRPAVPILSQLLACMASSPCGSCLSPRPMSWSAATRPPESLPPRLWSGMGKESSPSSLRVCGRTQG